MSNKQTITLRIPLELKMRLEREAQYQGTSVNQLTNYLLATQLAQMETLSSLESKLSKRTIPDLKGKVKKIMKKIPDRPVPAWDLAD